MRDVDLLKPGSNKDSKGESIYMTHGTQHLACPKPYLASKSNKSDYLAQSFKVLVSLVERRGQTASC